MEETVTQSVTLGFILSGLLCGGFVGLILQRGRFCMNSAFRDTIFIQDYTLFRGFLIALAVMVIGSNLLNDMGLIELKSQTFFPLANIIGGYLFGMGMVLASGCGSGIVYKGGEGQIAAVIGVIFFFLGIGATNYGILNPLYVALRSVKFEIAGNTNTTLWQLFGDSMTVKWTVIIIFALFLFSMTLKDKPFRLGKQKGFYWSVTGLLPRDSRNTDLLGLPILGRRVCTRDELHNSHRRAVFHDIDRRRKITLLSHVRYRAVQSHVGRILSSGCSLGGIYKR